MNFTSTPMRQNYEIFLKINPQDPVRLRYSPSIQFVPTGSKLCWWWTVKSGWVFSKATLNGPRLLKSGLLSTISSHDEDYSHDDIPDYIQMLVRLYWPTIQPIARTVNDDFLPKEKL